MTRKTHHVVHHSDGGWDVRKGGANRASRHFEVKIEAEAWGRQVSRNQGTDLFVHGLNGLIQRSDGHRHEPGSSPG